MDRCRCLQIEVRKAESGQVIFKDSMSSSETAIVKGDYRGDGADQVVVCAVNGEVRHILMSETDASSISCRL